MPVEVPAILLIAACLGACLIRALWEIQRRRERRSQIRPIQAWRQIDRGDEPIVARTIVLHDMENKVPSPKEEQASGVAGFITFGVICTILLGLVVWQPKAAAVWIAEAVEAESSKTTREATPARSAAQPMRKPIQPTAWAQVIDQGK